MAKNAILYAMMLMIGSMATIACGDDDSTEKAYVQLQNDFDNPDLPNPPWTICKAYYNDTFFDKVDIGETGEEFEVEAGLGYVYMILAWDDPDCNPENCLPVASRNEEEVVPGQSRTIVINVPNHQGPCPPQGVEPIPEDLYNQILELWPEYEFEPYENRTQNPQCGD